MKRFSRSAAAALFLCVPAAAYYTPRNPNFSGSSQERTRSARRAKKSAAEETAAVLMPGRWSPAARIAIDELIRSRGLASKNYDAQRPPFAVLSWEGVFYSRDAARAVFAQMTRDAAFKTSEDFWGAIPIAYGRQEIRSAYEDFSALPRAIWPEEPAFALFRSAFARSYESQCRSEGWSACRAFLAELFCGFSPDEARSYAASAIAARGLAGAPEIKELIAALRESGFDVWVVDEDPQPVLEAETLPAGVSSSRIIGVRTGVVHGLLNAHVAGDIPARGAKTAAIVSATGRAPDLVIGASPDDEDLLNYGTGVRVLIDHGDKRLDALAREKGWILQKPFGP